jgi:hypothetical protein
MAMVLVLLLVSISLSRSASVCTPPTPVLAEHTISSDNPHLSLTYYSRWNHTETTVHSGDTISGDRIVLNATWTPSGLVNRTRIEVNATAIPRTISNESQSTSAWINTRGLGNNATCIITASGWLFNGSSVKQVVTSVFLGNFFVPHVRVTSPNGGDRWTGPHNITWIAWDNNTDETLRYEVLFSSDSGLTFQLLAKNLDNTWFTWHTEGFLNLTTYMVEVKVSDGIYTSYDRSDATFTVGDVSITSTTTTTTTTTTDNSYILGLFISAAIISSAIMSLIVYYAAKRWY